MIPPFIWAFLCGVEPVIFVGLPKETMFVVLLDWRLLKNPSREISKTAEQAWFINEIWIDLPLLNAIINLQGWLPYWGKLVIEHNKMNISFSYPEADGDNRAPWDSEILYRKGNHCFFFKYRQGLGKSKVFMIRCLVISREEWTKFILLPNYHFHNKNQHPLSFLWSLLWARCSQFEMVGKENAVLTAEVDIMCRIIQAVSST